MSNYRGDGSKADALLLAAEAGVPVIGYASGDRARESAVIVNAGQVFLSRGDYDLLGGEAVRKLAGGNAEVTIIETSEETI